jgi:hypothetical protein
MKSNGTAFFTRIAAAACLLLAGPLLTAAALSGGEIIAEVDERQSAGTETAELTMTVFDNAGDPGSARSFRVESFSRGPEEQVMFFREPRRIAGMAILTREEGQWVHFPSTGRVRRVSGAAKSRSVSGVGGDFSYADLGSGTWGEDYSFTICADTETSWTLEGMPRSEDAVYSRLVMSVRKEDYIVERIEFYEGGSAPEKTLHVKEIRSFDGRREPARLVMRNPGENSKTELVIHDISYGAELDDRLFHPRRFYQ